MSKKQSEDGYKTGIYRNSAQLAEDNKSSAWTLLSVGIVGLVAVVLILTGVIELSFFGTTNYLMYGVMIAMFLLFIVMGAVSLRNSRLFSRQAESESTLSDTMRDWCLKNINAKELDASIFTEEEEEAEEIKYFRRCEELKQMLSDKFMNLDEGFLDNFVDQIYGELYEEQA